MEDLEEFIGHGRELELQFASRDGAGIAEYWMAQLYDVDWPEDDYASEPTRTSVADARIVRVDLDNGDWWDSLDAESADLMVVGNALRDRDGVTELDEDSMFSGGLVVLDHVFVPEEHRGNRASHALVRGVAAIFRNDIIALTPDSMKVDDNGILQPDDLKAAALVRHWESMGFIRVPNHEVWMLPYVSR